MMSMDYKIKVFDIDFVIVFGQVNNVISLHDRKITTCTIVELPSRKIYSGSSIKNPIDRSNYWEGRRYAFKRAVYFLWVIWTDHKKTNIAFQCFWQAFRKALGRNIIYLEERLENE